MADKNLKKLSRKELLEMLLSVTAENEQLRADLKEAQEKYERREIIIKDSESLAEACLRISGVLETMQAACDEYKANVYRKMARRENHRNLTSDK